MRERKGGWKVGERRNKNAISDGSSEKMERRAKNKKDWNDLCLFKKKKFSIQSWLQIGQIKKEKISRLDDIGWLTSLHWSWSLHVCVFYWFLLLTAFRNKMISIPGWCWRSKDTPSKHISISQIQTLRYWFCSDADNRDKTISGRCASLVQGDGAPLTQMGRV